MAVRLAGAAGCVSAGCPGIKESCIKLAPSLRLLLILLILMWLVLLLRCYIAVEWLSAGCSLPLTARAVVDGNSKSA